MKPKRILQVFTIMNYGGAETMVMNYYRKLNHKKVQFDFLVHRAEKGAYEDEIISLGGKVHRLPAINPLTLHNYKKAVRDFFDDNPSYDIIHGHLSELGVYIYKEAAKRNKTLIIAHAHSKPRIVDIKSIFRFVWKHKMRRYINDYFACNKESAEWLFGKKLSQNAKILNNAINIDKFKFSKETRSLIRKEFGIKDEFVIGHVGRFTVEKNHEFIIKLFSEVQKNENNTKLILVGTGPLQDSIKELAKELRIDHNIIFTNSRSDVNRVLQALDLFVLPSFYEGLPVAVVEAQAAGLKCLVSSNVDRNVNITGNVDFYDINKSAVDWANKTLSYRKFQRNNSIDTLFESQFNIEKSVLWLQDYYTQ